jgi:hypothetical protein
MAFPYIYKQLTHYLRMRKHLITYCLFPFYFYSFSTRHLYSNGFRNHYLQRLEIKTGLVKNFIQSNKPYDRKIVIDYINGIRFIISDMD